jgi:hypothetical protein
MEAPDVFADHGPTIGGRATLVLCSRETEIDPRFKGMVLGRATLTLKQQIAAIDDTAPRRGPRRIRQYAFLSLRLAKGVNPKAALKTLRACIRRVKEEANPRFRQAQKAQRELKKLGVRAERRAIAQQARSARGTKPSELKSFQGAFGLK